MRSDIEGYWLQMADIANAMPFHVMERAAKLLLDCQRKGATIFVAGNGGSAATASHFACDLSKGTRTEGLAPFRVVPLTDNVALLTAWANDSSYERVFAEQLATLVHPDDVVVAISTSGDSPNVLALAEEARGAGAKTIALTGRQGGQLRWLADLTIRVPSDTVELIEDAHSIVAHSLCVALRQRLRAQHALQVATAEVAREPTA